MNWVYGQRRSICLYDSPLHGMVSDPRPFGNHWTLLEEILGLDPTRGHNESVLVVRQTTDEGRGLQVDMAFLLSFASAMHLQEHQWPANRVDGRIPATISSVVGLLDCQPG